MLGVRALLPVTEYESRAEFIRAMDPTMLRTLIPRILLHACDPKLSWARRALALSAIYIAIERGDIGDERMSMDTVVKISTIFLDTNIIYHASMTLEEFFFQCPFVDAIDVLTAICGQVPSMFLTVFAISYVDRYLAADTTSMQFAALTILALIPSHNPEPLFLRDFLERTWARLQTLCTLHVPILNYAFCALISVWGQDTTMSIHCATHQDFIIPHLLRCLQMVQHSHLQQGDLVPLYIFASRAIHVVLESREVEISGRTVYLLVENLCCIAQKHLEPHSIPAIGALGSVAKYTGIQFAPFLAPCMELLQSFMVTLDHDLCSAVFFATLEFFHAVNPSIFLPFLKSPVGHALHISRGGTDDLGALFAVSLLKDYSSATLQALYTDTEMALLASEVLPLSLILIQKPTTISDWRDVTDMPIEMEMKLVIGLTLIATMLGAANTMHLDQFLSPCAQGILPLLAIRNRIIRDLACCVLITVSVIHGLATNEHVLSPLDCARIENALLARVQQGLVSNRIIDEASRLLALVFGILGGVSKSSLDDLVTSRALLLLAREPFFGDRLLAIADERKATVKIHKIRYAFL